MELFWITSQADQPTWPSAPANQNPPNTIDQPEPQTPPVNVEPPQSVSFPNAAEWSGLGNEVEGPYVHVSPPRKPSAPSQAGQPSNNDWMSMPFSDIFNDNLFFGQMDFLPENSASYETYWVPMRLPVMDPQLPPPPPPQSCKSLIIKSKNGYQRAKLLHNKDAYWSDVGMQERMNAKNPNSLPRKVQNPQSYRKM